jgi:hypothetical protein
MKKIILLKKNFIFLLSFLSINLIFSYEELNDIECNEKLGESSVFLYFKSDTINQKNESQAIVPVSYLGNFYEVALSSHFGGQVCLQEYSIQNKYYIVVSNHIEYLLDNNSCIRGYRVDPDNRADSKMYVMYLQITANEKNDMSYNWKIEELEIPERSLPENVIIIYSDPKNISFNSFDGKFNRAYPNINNRNSSLIILPQASFSNNLFLNKSLSNETALINTVPGHKKIQNCDAN